MKVYTISKSWSYDGGTLWAIFDTLAKAEHEKVLLLEENKESRWPNSDFYVIIEEFDVL